MLEARVIKQIEADVLAIVESTNDLMWSVGLDGKLTYFNGAYRRAFQLPHGATPSVGMLSTDLMPPEKAGVFPPLYERALTEGHSRTEYTIRDGRTLEMEFHSIVDNGKATGVCVVGKDITRWKDAVQSAREAERNFRAIFDGALEGLYQVSFDGKLLIANAALARMLAYRSPQELLVAARDVSILWVNPDDRIPYLEQIHRYGFVRGYECRFTRKDGAEIWVALSARTVEAAEGQKAVIEGFVEDITERKLALDTLREKEAQLRHAERLALTGSSVWDAATDVSTWTEGLYRIMGWDPKRPAPTREERHTLYTPESWARISEAARNTFETGNPYDLELQIVRKDGKTRWVHARGIANRDASGRVSQIVGVIRDVTERKMAESRLRESEERYRATFEQAAIGIVHAAFDGRILRCNSRFAQIVGYSIDEIKGISYAKITAPEAIDTSALALQQLVSGSSTHTTWEKRYIRKDDSLVWVKLTSSIQRDNAGRPLHLETFIEDITAQKAAEQKLDRALHELRASETRYRTIFQTSLDGISISRFDDGHFIDANQTYLNMLGFERDEVIGHTCEELGVWTDANIRKGIVELLRRDSSFRSLAVPARRKDGSSLWMQLSAAITDLEGVECIVCVSRDTSEIRAAEERIKDLAFYDQLTRLPNRRLLLERLERSLAIGAGDSRERALLLLDLDNFKKFNDALGHDAGDLLLQEVGRRLIACVRGDDTVARCDGDEFAILLEGLGAIPNPATEQAEFVAAKICTVLGQPYSIAGYEYQCDCSIGITIFGSDPHSAPQVLQQAELALHQAKIEGRNATRFFAPHLQAAVAARAAMEDELRRAVRGNQFLVYYQPQVDTVGLVGAEALVRWNHPSRGILAPEAFIALAEDTGLILPLGERILHEACTQISRWAMHPQTASIVLSVNISARQFRQPDFVEKILEVLLLTGANPATLRLELTESMLVDDIESVIAKMSALKERGVRFSIDDFGTGYSSLSYLKRLPIDQLKIDRSFVDDILLDETGGAIAQAIVSLGRAMGLSVIAEGVEAEEQRDYLIGLGCDAFQGYLFGSPLPLDEFEKKWCGQGASSPRLFLTRRGSS